MNAYTPVLQAHAYDALFTQSAVSGVYRALAIAEAEWQAHRELAILDGRDPEDDDVEWDVYLQGNTLELQ